MSGRRTVIALAALALTFSSVPGAAGRAARHLARIYVAPTGADSGRGTRGEPLATIDAARRMAGRLFSRARGAPLAVDIRLRGGVYRLPEPFVLRPEDGPPAGSTLTYEAEPGENPVLSGGISLRAWRPDTLNGHAVWNVALPVAAGSVREFWVNGERMPQSRYPRAGYIAIAGGARRPRPADWQEGDSAFACAREDIPPGENFSGAEAVVMNRWVESRLPVMSFDADSALFLCTRRSVFRLEEGDLCYLANVRSAFGAPGDWYADERERALYYYPRPGERPGEIDAVVPLLTTLVRVAGVPDSGIVVDGLTVRGITFAHAGWYFPDSVRGPGGFPQAATGVPAAFVARGLHHALIDRCTFTHMGTCAIELGAGCSGVVIRNSEFADLGAGGIRIGEQVIRDDPRLLTGGNTVADCRIHDAGRLFHSAVGIWIGQSGRNRLLHNQIHDLFYTGISIGWTWGYGEARATGNIVEMNHVHHCGVLSSGEGPILSDMGGIYTLGNQRGTLIRNNIFHDIAGYRYGGWGIYFDEGTAHCTAEANIVYNTTHGGFHQHYGRENRFAWNILAWGRDAQVVRTRYENHPGFAFEHNIVLWRGGSLIGGNAPWGNLVFDRNVYWNAAGGSVRCDTLSWQAWRTMGYDRHSRIADPGFRDPAHGDFTLREGAVPGFPRIPVGAILREEPLENFPLSPPPRRRRLLFNSDGSNIFWRTTFSADSVYADVDRAADGGVTTFLFNPNPSQRVVYPGSAWEMFTYDFPAAGARNLTGRDTLYRCFSENLRGLIRDSLDPVGMILDRARMRGMEAFLSVRMNDLHDVDVPGSPLLGSFWKEHPLYRVGGHAGWGASALNYALAPVREHFAGLIRELCARYAADGIELDFMRFPYYFPPGFAHTASAAGVMTAFVRDVRAIVDSASRARGGRMLLAVRVPSTPAGCAAAGLDPARWSREHLVDMITAAPFLSTEEWMPVGEFRAHCAGTPLYACFEFMCGDRMMTTEEIRGAAAVFYGEGADGIYAFNFFCSREGDQSPAYDVFNDLGDPAHLGGMDKVYTVSASRYPVPRVSPPAPLPLDLGAGRHGGRVTLRACELRPPARAYLRIECDREIAPGDIAVSFNAVRLGAGTHPLRGFIVPRPVLYAEPAASHALEFPIDPAILRRSNTVGIAAAAPLRVDWLYLRTVH
ncbi:MAG TPA: right-handed parallel beta-helix repeat-containing protein [Bacteroidota bacterium]|nr:right-handed parallel beta-helix repeat-containing protein [Bacteroidota bacterium]